MNMNLSTIKVALAILFFIPILSYSQESDGGISLGVKGGASFNSLAGKGAGTVVQRTGYIGGLFLNVSFLKIFSVQPEVLIHQGGATNTVNNNVDVIKLNYVEVPVLFKIRLPLAGVLFPNIFAGPDFSYKVGSTYTSTNQQSGQTVTIDKGNITKTGTGAVVGAGLDIQLDHLFLSVDGRYGASFTNLGNSTYDLNVHNKYFTLMAGVGVKF
jgi:hypothetical protein